MDAAPEQARQSLCRHCREPIDPRATVCSKCRIHQWPYLGIVLSFVPGIVALFSVVSLGMAVMQFMEARQKGMEAAASAARAVHAEEEASEAEEETRKLSADAEFTAVLVEALNGSRSSLDELTKIAASPTNRFAPRARIEVAQILGLFDSSASSVDPKAWAKDVDLEKITFDDARKKFQTAPGADALKWLEFIGAKDNADDRGFTAQNRLTFLLSIIRESPNLRHALAAEHLFRRNAGEAELYPLPPFSAEAYARWWETNKTNY
jgi:hypothetical protein